MLLGLWLVLDGFRPTGLVVGIPAAACVAWFAARRLPRARLRPKTGPLLGLLLFLLWDTILAGIDVALRSLHPRLPLKPGLVEVECDLPAGPRRDLFLAIAGLMPGSLPAGVSDNGRILIHCLDTSQPAAAQMAAQKARVDAALPEATRP